MKTRIWVLLTLMLSVASASIATETPKMNITGDENKILVSFESLKPCPVEITVTRDDGAIVYYWESETPENAVNLQVKMKELGKGTFNVSLKYGCQSINRELCIKRKEVKVGPSFELLEPFFCFKNDKLNVSFLNIANKNVYLNIYRNGEYYDGVTLGKDFDIQKSIDFSQVEKGDYKIVLTDYFNDHHFLVTK